MSLPPLAQIPPADIRLSIGPEEWEACLESWLMLSDLYLRLPAKDFSAASTEDAPLIDFIHSFYHESACIESGDGTFSTATARKLQKSCFLLVHRIVLGPKPVQRMLKFNFVADFCHVHAKSLSLSRLMSELWRRKDQALQTSIEQKKRTMMKAFDLPRKQDAQSDLRQLADFMRASPDAATLFMTGSDFLDALVSQYNKSTSLEERKVVVATTYLGLLSLIKTESPNASLLSDHLYSLKAQADSSSSTSTLLAELVINTPLITSLKRNASESAAERLFKLLDTVQTYRSPSIEWPKKHSSRKLDRSKGKAPVLNGEMHMHRLSLVSQVKDLFPDLGSGFILKLLDKYDDNVEQVTAHLLDDSLPPHLRDLDRSEQAPAFEGTQETNIEGLAPRSTPPPPKPFIPDRRNVFDDDELDRLELDTDRLHIGKKKDKPSEGQLNKAAILLALAAFDSDDDERDDTYDVEDVGGTIDTAHPDGEPGPAAQAAQDENDTILFKAYKSSPELFGRTTNVRRGQPRQALKAETGMTDEAIEEWAIMLQRDPRRLRRLEARFSSFDGKQSELAGTAYRESPGGTETEDSDVPAGRGGFRGRGRGRGGRGRGGSIAGPSSDPNTASAQRRKEANKSSRANHNRRDQRARKMARGGLAG